MQSDLKMSPATQKDQALDSLCINTLRTLSIDMIEKANSGHPGLPLGAAPMLYVLFDRHLRFAPQTPLWADRDRFVLSAGHGSALLYAALHLYGYDLPLEQLKRFRQWESKTPGHPEYGVTAGVEATTGPLGQGIANAVGMAIAERALAQRLNRPAANVVEHFTYCLVGDGDLMEGLSAEASSLAGHLGLGKLICLYDSNDISLDGPTTLSFSTEDVAARYRAYGWHVEVVAQGNTDLEAIDRALRAAKAETARPSLIVVKTTIGFGSPNRAGSAKVHGAPLGKDELAATKRQLGWSESEPFSIPAAALAHFRRKVEQGQQLVAEWERRQRAWAAAHPDLAAMDQLANHHLLPEGWDSDLPSFPVGQAVATRDAGGAVLNALARKLPWLLGGDADLSESTKTGLKDAGRFDGRSASLGRNIHYGVREHAMGSIANGIAYHGGLRSFTATFFCFADYMRPAMRLAALNHLPVVFVFTHDSLALGEDGPTHQPVEHLASLRCIPGLRTIRPADAAETAVAWRAALEHHEGPTALVLTRQKLPVIDRQGRGSAEGLLQGGYVLSEGSAHAAHVTLIGTGSEVALALEVQALLERRGVATRVVSLPCWELFEQQDSGYRRGVLRPGETLGVAIELGVGLGWERYVGRDGLVISVERFGASAPAEQLLEHYGFSAAKIAERVQQQLKAR
jgi:transketolase